MLPGASSVIHSAAESERAAIVWAMTAGAGRGGARIARSEQKSSTAGVGRERAVQTRGEEPAHHWRAACRLHTYQTIPVA